MEQHVIEIDYSEARPYWQCDCGSSGSVSAERADLVDVAAERHVSEGEPVSYRTRPGR